MNAYESLPRAFFESFSARNGKKTNDNTPCTTMKLLIEILIEVQNREI